MDWKHLLAYITGSIDQESLLRNEYLVAKNRWHALHYLETGWSYPEIAPTIHLSDAQVEAVAQYIAEHKEELLEVHRQIEARKACGNPPEITAKLTKSRTKLQEWLTQHHQTKT